MSTFMRSLSLFVCSDTTARLKALPTGFRAVRALSTAIWFKRLPQTFHGRALHFGMVAQRVSVAELRKRAQIGLAAPEQVLGEIGVITQHDAAHFRERRFGFCVQAILPSHDPVMSTK